MPGGHRQEVADRHGPEVLRWFHGDVPGKEFRDRIIKREFTFCDGEADRCAREALAERVKYVRFVRRFRGPPCFRSDLAVTQDHETVHRIHLPVRRFHKGLNGDW
jgi:hypothetical protein